MASSVGSFTRLPAPRAPRHRRRAVAAAAASLILGATTTAAPAHAQQRAAAPEAAAAMVTITTRGDADAGVAGFGGMPLATAPLQAAVFGTGRLLDAGVASIGDLTRLDASLGDAYNAEGYWSILSSRGYTLDNRFNYRRDGLPINAETAIALDNKSRIELLKGTSGIQAGTSAPGGLVDLVVKRPEGRVRQGRIEVGQFGSRLAAVDLGDRFGADGRFGVRLNAAVKHLDPPARRTEGRRSLLALAADWQLGRDTLLQAEVESSRQRQPSVAGFSMLGDSVPDARSVDPRLNLNDQPWRQPVVMDGDTASLRWRQRLSADWNLTVHAMQQRLRSHDRTAFPYGVYDATTYDCPRWCDRYAPDGSFTYWEYVSDNERRTSSALAFTLAGRADFGGIEHTLETGALVSRYRGRFQDQVFDIAGTGRVDGSLTTPRSGGGTDANTHRDERSTELFIRDAMRLGRRGAQLWAGLRHTRLDRSSQRTSPDGSGSLRSTDYTQSATLPWLALTQDLGPGTLVYASWGQGLESAVAPNRPRYANAGEALPALKSRQFEVGLKHADDRLESAFTLFDIDRPQTADLPRCSGLASCRFAVDGSARHRGVEAQASVRHGTWTWQAGAMVLQAERRGSARSGINGQRPENVPTATLRAGAEWRPRAAPGLALTAALAAERDRVVLPYDTSVRIPGWARVDVGARWRQPLAGGSTLTWRLGIDNLADRRAWKESPYQFGHVYLYPFAPRTARLSVEATL